MAGNFAFLTRDIGDVTSVQIANPGNGNHALITIPGDEVWRVVSFRFLLTITIGNHVPNVAHNTVLASIPWSTAQQVIQGVAAVDWTFAIGLRPAPAIANLRFSWSLPDCYVGPGGTVGTSGNISLGRTFTNIWMQYQRWRV